MLLSFYGIHIERMSGVAINFVFSSNAFVLTGDQTPDCDPSISGCTQQHVLLPIMLAAYLLLGNVLLLNLLIAIFRYDVIP